MTIKSLIFYFLSFTTILSGLLVIRSKNPIKSVIYLVGTFISSAGIFLLLEINLLGLIYIIVYVGAIAILFIFVIMMMDIRNLNDQNDFFLKDSNSERFSYPLTFLLLLFFFLSFLIYHNDHSLSNDDSLSHLDNSILWRDYFSIWKIAQRNIWDSLLISMDLIHSIGYILYTDFLSLLLLISLVLLMIMVGVIVLILKKD